jgi:formate dehydrogenase subunit delta
MNVDHLVQMANQIGTFFQSMADATEAREGIATHLRKFWEPRMRVLLLERAQQGEASGLDALVLQAVQEHQAQLQPQR